MKELRPHLTDTVQFINQVLLQQQEGYQIAFVKEAQDVAACIGYRYLTTLAWGRIIYIDYSFRLSRKRGGSCLLQYVIQLAKVVNCDQVHLDTGYMRHNAHCLYLKQGVNFNCHHLSLIPKK